MIDKLKLLAKANGDRLAAIPIENIKSLQSQLAKYRNDNNAQLSDYQKWIFDELYRFDAIDTDMQSIIIVAVARPAYANVTWHLNGQQYAAFSGVSTNTDRTAEYITSAVQAAGYKINRETRLPLKNIAVQSGMAQYGRNNIVYVDGMGSALALLAFSTDAPPCDTTTWSEHIVSQACDGCKICITLCPTDAIIPDKFLIDSHKCLTRLAQLEDDFPEWVPPTAHHSTYYCLMCQARCPMNKGQKTIDISFNEKETARILDGGPYSSDDVSEELSKKIGLLNFGKLATAPRNLRVLFDAMDNGHVPRL